MLKFIPTTIAFSLAVIAFIALRYFGIELSYWLLFLCIVLFSIVQFLGAYLIQWNFHLTSINQLTSSEKAVMLSFDDGPHPSNTAKVLDILKKHRVAALFCVIGKNVAGNELLMNRMVHEGHQLANHSYSHAFWFDVWPTNKVVEDIAECQQKIKQYQPTSNLFRPPYGVTNPNIAKALKKMKLQSIGWSIRSYDTSTPKIEKIIQRILKQLKPNAIILLHDRLDCMPELLEQLIPILKDKGYVFKTIVGS